MGEQSSVPRPTLRFSLSHWVQGSLLPPAAQAIIFRRHFLDRLLG
jgi:hypothetical protein